jgi:large subunit ribosomal protein L10
MLRSEKEQIVSGLGRKFKDSQISLCFDYRGLTVAQVQKLRRSLQEVSAEAEVVKNTLLRRSVKEAGYDTANEEVKKFFDTFNGPSMVVHCTTDPIAPAKVLCKYVKDFEKLSLKGGYFEGEFLSESKLDELSKMPGREELLSQLLRIMLAPATNLVRLINEPGTRVARVLSAQAEKLS